MLIGVAGLAIAIGYYLYSVDNFNAKGRSCNTIDFLKDPRLTDYAKGFHSECVRLPKSKVSIHVLDNKNMKAKETIVFSHGLTFSTFMWNFQMKFFMDSYRIIAFDHRGQGLSESVAGDAPILLEQNRDDAIELVELLSRRENLGPVHLVGMSMGGFTAMRVAAKQPKLLKSLILINTDAAVNADLSGKFEIFLLVIRYVGFLRPIADNVIPEFFGERVAKNETLSKLWADYWVETIYSDLWRSARGIIDRPSFNDLKSIKTPTLVIHGSEDKIISVTRTNQLVAEIEGSKLVIIPGGGHQTPQDSSEEVNKAMESFLLSLK